LIDITVVLQDLTDVSLIVGPWNHAGTQHVRPFPGGKTSDSKFDHPHEIAAFFARALKGEPPEGPPAKDTDALAPLIQQPHTVRFFNMNEEAWRTAPAFPADPDHAASVKLFLNASRNGVPQQFPLSGGAPSENATAKLDVQVLKDRGCIGTSRYNAMTELFDHVVYSMEHPSINHLRFTSAPLSSDLDVSGFPTVSLWVSSSINDASVFAYLEVVDPATGKGSYVTEGMFRVSNRKEARPEDLQDGAVLTYPGTRRDDTPRASLPVLGCLLPATGGPPKRVSAP
jgi:uncharacterized protein